MRRDLRTEACCTPSLYNIDPGLRRSAATSQDGGEGCILVVVGEFVAAGQPAGRKDGCGCRVGGLVEAGADALPVRCRQFVCRGFDLCPDRIKGERVVRGRKRCGDGPRQGADLCGESRASNQRRGHRRGLRGAAAERKLEPLKREPAFRVSILETNRGGERGLERTEVTEAGCMVAEQTDGVCVGRPDAAGSGSSRDGEVGAAERAVVVTGERQEGLEPFGGRETGEFGEGLECDDLCDGAPGRAGDGDDFAPERSLFGEALRCGLQQRLSLVRCTGAGEVSRKRKRGGCIIGVARGCAAEQVQLLLGAARCLDSRFDLRSKLGVVRAPVEQADGEREGVGVAPTQCCDGEPEPALHKLRLRVGCEVLLQQGEHLDRFGCLREQGE